MTFWLRDFAVGSVVTFDSWLYFVMVVSDISETDHKHLSLTISSASLVVGIQWRAVLVHINTS